MLLEHAALDLFEPELRRITDIALGGGFRALLEKGLTPAEVVRDSGTYQLFIAGCHAGFNQSQAEIVKLVIALEEKLRQVKPGRATNRKEQLELVRVLKTRQLTLRRLTDAILFQVLYPEHRAVRYLATQKHMHPVDPKVLQKTAETAARLNGENPMKFHLIADLTSVVQIGDLICIDRSNPESAVCTVIELKEGRMNEILAEHMRDRPSPLSEQHIEEITKTFNEDAAKQARRMDRQKQRAGNFMSILLDDKGHIPLLDLPVSVDRDRVYVGDYFEALGEAWEEAKERGYAVRTVDECLHIIAVKSEDGKPYGRRGFAAHTAYHLVNDAAGCLLPDDERRPQELEAVAALDPALVNLIGNSLGDKMGHSPFLIGHGELVMDLLFERMFVYLYFDYARFFALAAESGLTLEWVTEKPLSQTTVVQDPIPGSPSAYGVRVTKDGMTDKSMLLIGFFRHAISDFTPPSDLVKLLLARQLKPSTEASTQSESGK